MFNREDEKQSTGDYKETYDVIPHKQVILKHFEKENIIGLIASSQSTWNKSFMNLPFALKKNCPTKILHHGHFPEISRGDTRHERFGSDSILLAEETGSLHL